MILIFAFNQMGDGKIKIEGSPVIIKNKQWQRRMQGISDLRLLDDIFPSSCRGDNAA